MILRNIRLVLLFFTLLASRVFAGNDDHFSLGMGIAGIGNETLMVESRFEYRFPQKVLMASPMAGMMVLGDGSTYFYGGVNFIKYYWNRLLVNPNFAAGGFDDGGEKNLGGILEFRSGMEVGYWIIDRLMVGVAFHHISNASIYKHNPGTETLSLIITLGSGPQKKLQKKCFEEY